MNLTVITRVNLNEIELQKTSSIKIKKYLQTQHCIILVSIKSYLTMK